MQKLIEEIEKTGNDGAVMFKLDEKGNVTHISPLVKAQDIETMYNQLSQVRSAIDSFLKDIVDKNLHKN